MKFQLFATLILLIAMTSMHGRFYIFDESFNSILTFTTMTTVFDQMFFMVRISVPSNMNRLHKFSKIVVFNPDFYLPAVRPFVLGILLPFNSVFNYFVHILKRLTSVSAIVVTRMGFNLVSTYSIQVICLICLYANVARINVINTDHRSFNCMNKTVK